MKKLSTEEIKDVSFLSEFGTGAGRQRREETTLLLNILDGVDVGGGVLVTKSEWNSTSKSPSNNPASTINLSNKRGGKSERFSGRTLKDKSGWVVVRTV